MSEIVLFHHVQGLTPGISHFADRLRAAGHTVHAPDLFDGRTFADIESGSAHAQSIGFGTLLERGAGWIEDLPAGLVYAGFSMGVMPAQMLAQTRGGAKGGLFIDGCIPVSEFGPWPEGLPAQVHGGSDDEWFAEDIDGARELAESVPAAELFLYPGTQHLFADDSSDSYDEEAAGLLLERVLSFLDEVDAG